jgi:hypothetical protein
LSINYMPKAGEFYLLRHAHQPSPETPRRSKVNRNGDHKLAVNAADQAPNAFVIPFDYRTTQPRTLVVYQVPNFPVPVTAPVMLSHAEILPHSRLLGRLKGLLILETDDSKLKLLKEAYDRLDGGFRDTSIGMLETYAALELVPAKKQVVRDLVREFEQKRRDR